MKIRKKLLSLLGAAAMAVTVMAVAGGAQEVKAASNTYVVNSSVADVTGNVGDTIEVPITFTTDTPTNSLLGKLRDNKNNVSYYDDTVLKFVGTEFRGMPAGLTSTAGGNFSYVSTETSTSGTIILKFEVLKCSPTPVTLNIKDLYYTTNAIKTDTVNLTSKITINHPTDKRVETVTKEPTCTEKGTKSVKCGECGADLGTEEIAALGHKAGDWKVTKEATCTEKGSKEQRCTVCGEVVKTEEIAKLAHTWKTDKDTDKDGWKVVTAATKDKEGSKERVCSVCGTKETATIAKLTATTTPTPTATPGATSGNKNNTTTGTTSTGSKTTSGTSTGSTAVKTGDSTNVAGMVAAVAASAGILVICGVMVMRRRKVNR